MKLSHPLGLLAAVAFLSWGGVAMAAPGLRVQVNQHGDFTMIGNTLGIDCATGTPAPVVGTILPGACTQPLGNVNDTEPDLMWRSDDLVTGDAVASLTNTPALARSTAILNLPAGSVVTNAFLYWGAENTTNTAGTTVTLDVPATGFTLPVTALSSFLGGNNAYQSVADVTKTVIAEGAEGVAYRVSGVAAEGFANVDNGAVFGGWALVVLYTHPGDPLRNLAVFDGLDQVSNGNPQNITLNGFLVPNAGFTGKLGVLAYEGDFALTGDQLSFNGTFLSDAQNPVDNFFNSSRSILGVAVSNVGDLPQLTGTPGSMSGMDLDIVDITGELHAGQTSAPVSATSTGDRYYLGAFVTSISTFQPDFSSSTKTVVDETNNPTVVGDTLLYTIDAQNTGNDSAINVVMTDVLPTGVTYVPGTLQITTGPNAGAKTDVAGDDQGEFNAATHTITVRLGTGATAATGGTLAVGASSTVTFEVKVNAGDTGTIANQAVINAAGLLGSPPTNTPTGNGGAAGAPTTVDVEPCATNAQCSAPTPICDTAVEPTECVQCLDDTDCGGATSGQVCNTVTDTCEAGCRGAGGNGCPSPDVCTSTDTTIGKCVACVKDSDCGDLTSGEVCNPITNTCITGCDSGGNGCPSTEVCTKTDGTIGACVACLIDANCGGLTSGIVCDTSNDTCVPGCDLGGNQCPVGQECEVSDAGPIGVCVGCLTDPDCGSTTSGIVCNILTHTCVPGCDSGGNGCPTGQDCLLGDAGPIGVCVGCLTDSDCGSPTSGKVCDTLATQACIDGCRGMDGNGCPAGQNCSSTTDVIGTCSQGTGGGGAGGATTTTTGTSSASGGGGAGGTASTSTSMGGMGGAATSTNTNSGTSTNTNSGTSTNNGTTSGAGGADKGLVALGGGFCATTPGRSTDGAFAALFAAAALALARRRRRSN